MSDTTERWCLFASLVLKSIFDVKFYGSSTKNYENSGNNASWSELSHNLIEKLEEKKPEKTVGDRRIGAEEISICFPGKNLIRESSLPP